MGIYYKDADLTFIQRYRGVAKGRVRPSNTSEIPVCPPSCRSLHSSSLSFSEEPAESASAVLHIENMAVDRSQV